MEGAEFSVEMAHAIILRRAEELANQAYVEYAGSEPEEAVYAPGSRFSAPPGKRKPTRGVASGMVFRADPAQSQRGGLALSIAENVDESLTNAERQRLWQIGADAIETAIIEHQDLLVAAILRDSFEGHNYFDRFAREGDQERLF